MVPNPPEQKDDEKVLPKKGNGNYLATNSQHLERRLKSLETEKQLLDTERLRLERELHALHNELDRLRQPPLIEAILVKLLSDKRVVVESSTGPRFIVNTSKKVKDILKEGQHVALNQRTFAVVEVIPDAEAEMHDFWWARSSQIQAYQWMLEELENLGPISEEIMSLREKVAQRIAILRV